MFSSYNGKVYEQELTRAAIERFATACSKLKPEVTGNSASRVARALQVAPNSIMTWPTFLKRAGAIYDADGTLVIVPTLDPRDGRSITGLFPLRFEYAEVLEYAGEPWIRFHFASGDSQSIELSNVCIINKFQIDSDIFGEDNCIDETMKLIHAQTQAQNNAIKNGAKIRFIGSLNGQVREEDLKKKRDRFMEDNFGANNESGLMLYDNTFQEVRQVEPQSYVIGNDEMKRIQENVCNYFGINEDILQNKYAEDVWGAWYEGKVEPFAIALGEGLTKMCYSPTQINHGNSIAFSANRLEYASNASKRNMVRDMLDRGVFTINEAREVLQLPKVPDGDVRVIRGEYVNAAMVSTVVSGDNGLFGGGRLPMNENEVDRDLGGLDKFYKDSDQHNDDDFVSNN